MAIRNQVIDVYRGNSQVEFIGLTNANGTALDTTIAGLKIEWRMATSVKGDTLVRKTFATGDGITAVTGGIDLELLPEDTDFEPGLYYHEPQIIDGPDVATFMTGVVFVRRAMAMGPMPEPTAANLVITTAPPIRTP